MLHWKKYFLVLDLANIANLFSSQDYHQIIKLAVDSEFRSQTNPLVAQIVAASYFRVGDFQSSLNLLEEIDPPLNDFSGHYMNFAEDLVVISCYLSQKIY